MNGEMIVVLMFASWFIGHITGYFIRNEVKKIKALDPAEERIYLGYKDWTYEGAE